MRHEHLVAFEYGTGTVWGFVEASSDEDVVEYLPELDVYDEVPAWMDGADLEELRAAAVPVEDEAALDAILHHHHRS